MPKLPLFEGQQVSPAVAAEFRKLLAQKEEPSSMQLISDLLDLHADPSAPMSQALTDFSIELGLIPASYLQNFLYNSLEIKQLSGFRGRMRLELHNWILQHAAAGGFLPAPPLPPVTKHPGARCVR